MLTETEVKAVVAMFRLKNKHSWDWRSNNYIQLFIAPDFKITAYTELSESLEDSACFCKYCTPVSAYFHTKEDAIEYARTILKIPNLP